jgi:hypothetical protein
MNSPAINTNIVILSLVTGIMNPSINLLPIGMIGRFIAVSSLLYFITKKRAISLATGCIMLYNPWGATGLNTIFVHGFGSILFYLFSLAVLLAAHQMTRRSFAVMLLLLTGLHFTDYTMIFWALSAIGLILVANMKWNNWQESKHWFSLLSLGGILYFTKHTPYTVFVSLQQDQSAIGIDPLSPILDYFGIAKISNIDRSRYAYEASGSENLFQSVPFSEIYYITCGSVVGAYIAIKVIQYLYANNITARMSNIIPNEHNLISEQDRYIGLITFGGLFGTLFYLTFFDRFTQTFIFLWAPILGVTCATRSATTLDWGYSEWVPKLVVVILIGTSGFSFILAGGTGQIATEGSSGREAGTFIGEYASNPNVLSDHNMLGKMSYSVRKNGAQPEWLFYNDATYERIVKGSKPLSEYLVVDSNNQATAAPWRKYEPMDNHRVELNTNNHLNSVYHHGSVKIYWNNRSS